MLEEIKLTLVDKKIKCKLGVIGLGDHDAKGLCSILQLNIPSNTASGPYFYSDHYGGEDSMKSDIQHFIKDSRKSLRSKPSLFLSLTSNTHLALALTKLDDVYASLSTNISI